MNKLIEQWKPVKGLEGYYEISNFGRVKSLSRKRKQPFTGAICTYPERILKTYLTDKRYMRVNLHKETRAYRYLVHTLVAKHFLERRDKDTEVNHLDGNKLNNHASNLEWCTHSENMKHALANGLKIPARGERQGSAVLTDAKVKKIRELSKTLSHRELGARFKVGHSTIGNILRGRNWTHV